MSALNIFSMQDPIQQIKEKLSIVDVVREYVHLMPAGKNLKGLCPFHKEKTPSFIVSPDRGTWHCFGSCNEGGDIFSFVMKYHTLEFHEALKMLAEKAGVELRQISPSSQKEFGVLYDIVDAAKDFFVEQRQQSAEVGEYLAGRALAQETIDAFEIGYAPAEPDALMLHLVNRGYDTADIERAGMVFKNERGMYIDRFRGRIMFPLYNVFGKVVGFSGRILPRLDTGTSGKYINTPETLLFHKSKVLYGFHKTKAGIRETGEAILVEGQMDLLMLYQDGVRNAVAVSGTALTSQHLDTIKKMAHRLVVAFDADEAGQAAAERAIDMAHQLDFEVTVFTVPEGKDAAEYVAAHPGAVARLIAASPTAVTYYIDRYIQNGQGSQKERVRHVLRKVIELASPLEQYVWIQKIAEAARVKESVLSDELAVLKKSSLATATHSDPRATVQTVESDRSSYEPRTRREKLWVRLFVTALIEPGVVPALVDAETFLPERYSGVLARLSGKESAPEDGAFLDALDMRSSLVAQEGSVESMHAETAFLLQEVRREYIRERREELAMQIQEAERAHDEARVKALVAAFDEMAKVIDNESRG
jgi:DNA primase